ncbi:ROK family protein [Pseudooctadecabacter jejudonensis]|uniref:ROK family protein n=1 Tax=Pseudooctadecabacter jejudonensis TaxID=1391910 RepID=UPI00279579A4|nr:ROK family protein [Pseudooctadecabacter jejudonensis]
MRQNAFEYVRAQGQATRTDITQALGISAGSATTLTADLITAGFLKEVQSPQKESSRGRPRVALTVVPDAGYVIGIKLAFKRHIAVMIDFSGNLIAQADLPSGDVRRPVEQLMDEAEALIHKLLAASGKSQTDICTVGIGLPGIIDHRSGVVVWSAMITTRDANLADLFAERFTMPVVLDNDANMLTLAELWFGQGRSMSSFAVVTIESGVGMGLVLDNQLYRGANGLGLELGHTKVQLDGALCRCGQRGCLEAYLADYALSREASTALDHASPTPRAPEHTLEALFQQAKAGHTAAETIFRRAGRYLSLGLSNVVQLFDPALIILSGERMQYDYLYAETVMDEMHKLTLNEGRKPCKIAIHAWGDLVWARGAAALALSHITTRMIAGEARAA